MTVGEAVHNAMTPDRRRRGNYSQKTQNILALAPLLEERYYVRGTLYRLLTWFCRGHSPLAGPGPQAFVHGAVGGALLGQPWPTKEEGSARLRNRTRQLAELCPATARFTFHFIIDWERGQCGARRAAGCGAGVGIVAVAPGETSIPVTSLSVAALAGWVPSLLA